MKKFIIAIVLLVGLWSGAKAQDNVTSITYQPSVPSGDLEEYIAKTSWLGWGIEGRHFRSPTSHFTLGFSFAWHVFDDRLTGTTQIEQGAITGTQRRYVNSLPFLLTGNYYLSRKGQFKTYIGAGAGAYYIVQRLDIGVWKKEESNWHFGVEAEVGTQFPLGDIEGVVGIRYHYAFAAGETISGVERDYQYATVVVGLAYVRW
jgi:opacity protein-like surface antigen